MPKCLVFLLHFPDTSLKAPKEDPNESELAKQSNTLQTDLQILTEYMLSKDTLVKLIRYCTVFEQEEVKC